MADQSVFKMSGAASEKLAALQNLSHTERASTYEQDLSKLVCSFMRPVSEQNPLQRSPATTNVEGPGETPRIPLPFKVIKPAESWSRVGVRTVADLKTAISTNKVPAKKLQSCDEGVDWRLRSSLYTDFHNERTVRLPYEIPGLAERAESPAMKMEGCANLTSTEVLDAMRVLEPPKRPSPCKPYTSPRANGPSRPQGTLPLINVSPSTPSRRKPDDLLSAELLTVKQPISTPRRKARMKFTKRRTDLEKNPYTGLLEPKAGFLPPDRTKDVMSETNNNNYLDKYCDGSIQEFRSEYASSMGSPSSGISIDRRDSFDGSTPLRSGSVDPARSQRRKTTNSECSCQDSVISSSEHNPSHLLQAPSGGNAASMQEDSQDVEFFDLTMAERSASPQDDAATPMETSTVTLQVKLSDTAAVIDLTAEDDNPIPNPNVIEDSMIPHFSVPRNALKQNASTQTQQSIPVREKSALVQTKKPKMINLLDLYKAVTLMKSEKRNSGVSLISDYLSTGGQSAPPGPERIII